MRSLYSSSTLQKITLAAVAFFGLTSPLHATLLLSENFDELKPTLGATSIGAFSAIGGTNVDIVGAANGWGFLCAAPGGGNCIDMDGTGGNPLGLLQSNLLFGAGTYLLSFNLLGNQRGGSSSTTVRFGDYNQNFLLGSSNNIAGIISNQQVTLSAAGYLQFLSNDPTGDQQGNVLDNVTVSTSSTPEPASLLLLGTGLSAGMGFMAFRRRSINPSN